MEHLPLEGHLGRPVEIDLCQSCQAIWFDKYESLQLSAGSVLTLFRVIGQAGAVKSALSIDASCPRCSTKLRVVRDLQRSTRFEYRACPDTHGRLITFFNFLREKDFVRPLSAAQIENLKRNVKTVNCSNCGAPVDLARGTSCDHCGSPLSMLDMKQAEELVARLRDAGRRPQPKDPTALDFDLTRARRDVNAAFATFERSPGWYEEVSSSGLISTAVGALSAWLAES